LVLIKKFKIIILVEVYKMSLKEQFKRIKDNWLIVLLLVVIVGIIAIGPSEIKDISFLSRSSEQFYGMDSSMAYPAAEKMAMSYSRGGGIYYDSGFAPDVEDRKITKNANLNSKVEKGFFSSAEKKLKDIVKSSDSFLLDENVNKYGTNRKEYYQGSYRIKVETSKYDSVISQLKEIGEIVSFNEYINDITGSYTNLEVELAAEKSRLEKYKQIYEESKSAEEKFEVTDRIFNLERTIKYYEDALKNMDKRIDYSEIYISIQEKQSEYVDLVFVKFSHLMKSLVNSINGLLNFIFVILPYAIIIGIIVFFVRRCRKSNCKRK
jgi:hypothetical protein